MIYALNVYDIIPGKESVYADYAAAAGAVIATLDMRIVAAGDKPIREITGQSRNHFVLAEFADVESFDRLMDGLAERDLHRLRESATENYIWTLYEPWNFGGGD